MFSIDHALFRQIDDERETIISITKLFEPNELNVKCVFCDEEDEKFVCEIKNIETIKIDSIIKKKRIVIFGNHNIIFKSQ